MHEKRHRHSSSAAQKDKIIKQENELVKLQEEMRKKLDSVMNDPETYERQMKDGLNNNTLPIYSHDDVNGFFAQIKPSETLTLGPGKYFASDLVIDKPMKVKGCSQCFFYVSKPPITINTLNFEELHDCDTDGKYSHVHFEGVSFLMDLSNAQSEKKSKKGTSDSSMNFRKTESKYKRKENKLSSPLNKEMDDQKQPEIFYPPIMKENNQKVLVSEPPDYLMSIGFYIESNLKIEFRDCFFKTLAQNTAVEYNLFDKEKEITKAVQNILFYSDSYPQPGGHLGYTLKLKSNLFMDFYSVLHSNSDNHVYIDNCVFTGITGIALTLRCPLYLVVSRCIFKKIKKSCINVVVNSADEDKTHLMSKIGSYAFCQNEFYSGSHGICIHSDNQYKPVYCDADITIFRNIFYESGKTGISFKNVRVYKILVEKNTLYKSEDSTILVNNTKARQNVTLSSNRIMSSNSNGIKIMDSPVIISSSTIHDIKHFGVFIFMSHKRYFHRLQGIIVRGCEISKTQNSGINITGFPAMPILVSDTHIKECYHGICVDHDISKVKEKRSEVEAARVDHEDKRPVEVRHGDLVFERVSIEDSNSNNLHVVQNVSQIIGIASEIAFEKSLVYVSDPSQRERIKMLSTKSPLGDDGSTTNKFSRGNTEKVCGFSDGAEKGKKWCRVF